MSLSLKPIVISERANRLLVVSLPYLLSASLAFSAYSILKYSMNASKSSLLHLTVVPPSAISLCSLFPRLTVSASCFLMSSIFFSVSLFPFPCPCPMPPCSPFAACTSLSSPCLPPSGFLPCSFSFCGIRRQL